MRVKPVLDDWEIPRIDSMKTAEHRDLVELPVPGRAGSLFQDMNRAPARVSIRGSLYGDEARSTFLETLRNKYHTGEPVTFIADILTATEVQYVLIEDLYFEESAAAVAAGSRAGQCGMRLHRAPPPPPPDPFGALDTSLLDQAGGFLDSITGALDAIDGLGNIPNIGNPTAPLTNALDGLTAATSGLGENLNPLTEIFGDGKQD